MDKTSEQTPKKEEEEEQEKMVEKEHLICVKCTRAQTHPLKIYTHVYK